MDTGTQTKEQTMSTEMILCKTRTGKKVHLGYPTSSVTACGHWQKVANAHYKLTLPPAEIDKLAQMGSLTLCEHCFPSGTLAGYEAPTATTDPTKMTLKELIESGLTENTDLAGTKARQRAAFLFRTMSVQERFSYLSVRFPPRLQKVYRKEMGTN